MVIKEGKRGGKEKRRGGKKGEKKREKKRKEGKGGEKGREVEMYTMNKMNGKFNGKPKAVEGKIRTSKIIRTKRKWGERCKND